MEAIMVRLKKFLGVSDEYKKKRHYEIQLDIVGDSAVQMNMESFKNSPAVKEQMEAARDYVPGSKING